MGEQPTAVKRYDPGPVKNQRPQVRRKLNKALVSKYFVITEGETKHQPYYFRFLDWIDLDPDYN